MLFVDGAFGLVLFALWVFCLFDVVMTDPAACRNLGKVWWVLVVVVLADVGAVLWLVAGRPWPGSVAGAGLPHRGNGGEAARFPEYERPGRFAATSSADDEEFLRRCRERAEEQRRRYRERRPDDQA